MGVSGALPLTSAEVLTEINKYLTNAVNKITDARALALDHLDADISAISTDVGAIVAQYSEKRPLTVTDFQLNAATGTSSNPQRLNDGSTATGVESNIIGEYAEVDLGATYVITQFRHFGHTQHSGDGVFKIQRKEGAAWVDWVAGIAVRVTGDWAAWVEGTVIAAQYLRVTHTIIDTGVNINNMPEFEAKY